MLSGLSNVISLEVYCLVSGDELLLECSSHPSLRVAASLGSGAATGLNSSTGTMMPPGAAFSDHRFCNSHVKIFRENT